jgi:hypothetical protein
VVILKQSLQLLRCDYLSPLLPAMCARYDCSAAEATYLTKCYNNTLKEGGEVPEERDGAAGGESPETE